MGVENNKTIAISLYEYVMKCIWLYYDEFGNCMWNNYILILIVISYDKSLTQAH